MDKIATINRSRKRAHKRLTELKSGVYAAFLDMEERAFSDGALPKKVKELIALGISVAVNCESCMQWHLEQAKEAGATSSEILEAIEVGIEMPSGKATVSARFAIEVMDRLHE
jgi:AhpD family alkylhydroperoxidase